MSGFASVGSLLADIANLVVDGLCILSLSDKRHWGPDEHEQVRALEHVLDEAKKDFQELSPLVNGQSHYEHDRRQQTIEELRALRNKFHAHVQDLKDWCRSGGPINPMWMRHTRALQRELHRAQCRAAGRIFTTAQESAERCLGAFLVRRQQRAATKRRVPPIEGEYRQKCMAELAVCNAVGGFERLGDEDIAYICDFCDGHMVWEDLKSMPTMRLVQPDASNPPQLPIHSSTPTPGPSSNPPWRARGMSIAAQQEKDVVFAPLVIANHFVPRPGDWQARITCPFCEELAEQPQEDDDGEDQYRPDYEFDDVAALQEHLEWQHSGSYLPSTLPVALPSTSSCSVM